MSTTLNQGILSAQQEIFLAKEIPRDSAINVFKHESTGLLLSPREMTHFVSDRAVNFDNGDIVRNSVPVTKGLKTFNNSSLPFDFLISKLGLRAGSATTDNDRTASTFAEPLPASLILGKVKITQGIDVISISASELYNGNTEKTKDFFYLKNPIFLRKDINFSIVFEFVNTPAATEAYRVEMGGLEYAVASSTLFGKSL